MPTSSTSAPDPAAPRGDGATILLVEDEPAILRVTARLLTQLGYMVLSAAHATTALEIARAECATIDLLLTDVLMPDINGVELAREVQRIRPEIRVLFMSGYTADALREPMGSDPQAQLVQKPFARDAMARAISATLAAAAQ